MVKSTVTLVGGKEMVSRDSVTSALSCNLLGSEQLSAQQALAPVRVIGHFAPKSAKPNITPVCAANIHRQKNGGLERTMQFTALRVIRHVIADLEGFPRDNLKSPNMNLFYKMSDVLTTAE